jgi:hypothetical protein
VMYPPIRTLGSLLLNLAQLAVLFVVLVYLFGWISVAFRSCDRCYEIEDSNGMQL